MTNTLSLRFACFFACAMAFIAPAPAGVIGDPVIQRPEFDGGTGQLFVYAGDFSAPTQKVASWSFYSDQSASNNCSTGQASYVCSPGSSVTPVLLKQTGVTSFEVTGIGRTRPNSISGVQSFAFDLQQGSAVVGPGFTFGFRSGGPTDSGDFDFGVVDFDNSQSLGYYYVGERVQVIVGDSYVVNGPSRAYSIQFTTSPIPEPSTVGVVCFGLLFFCLRQKAA